MESHSITAVTTLDRSHYLTKVYADGHFIYADEPLEAGGTNEGMSPMVLLLASLGSCTAITVRMYADRKGMQLEGIEIHAALNPSTAEGDPAIISQQVSFTGKLNEQERMRLSQIAEKCPVHKLLSRPIQILTTTV